jgi:hypothetical protein
MKYIALAATALALATPAVAEVPLNSIVSTQSETAATGFAIGGTIGTATIVGIVVIGSLVVLTLLEEDGTTSTTTTTTST